MKFAKFVFLPLAIAAHGLALCPIASAQGVRSAYEPTAPAADPALTAEGGALVDRAWTRLLRRCGTSAFYQVDDRIMIELDRPRLSFVPMRLPDAASQSGYAFRGVALASASKWRWANITGSRLKWSEWAEGETKVIRDDNLTLDRGFTTVADVVLRLDIVKKDGAWSATAPISLLSYAVKPLDLAPPESGAAAPQCDIRAPR